MRRHIPQATYPKTRTDRTSPSQGRLVSLFGLAPGGVYRAAVCCHPRGALLPHLFTLAGAFQRLGGIFSVALSVGSRPPGVTWHPVLWSPDFPPRSKDRSDCLADSRDYYTRDQRGPGCLVVSFHLIAHAWSTSRFPPCTAAVAWTCGSRKDDKQGRDIRLTSSPVTNPNAKDPFLSIGRSQQT